MAGRTNRWLRATAGGLFAASLAAAGCEQRPPAQAEEVLDYLRNAAVGAKVRRLDGEAQTYVDEVMAAYRACQRACEPIATLAEVKALWPKKSKEWRDVAGIGKQLDEIRIWKGDKPSLIGKPPLTPVQRLAGLTEAIGVVPDLVGAERASFVEHVTTTLDLTSHVKWLEDIADDYMVLYALVVDHASDGDPPGPGLTFKTASVQTRADELWEKLDAKLRSHAEASVRRVLPEHEVRRDEALKEKETLYAKEKLSAEERRAFRRLEILIRYYDETISEAQARAKVLETDNGRENETAGEPAGPTTAPSRSAR